MKKILAMGTMVLLMLSIGLDLVQNPIKENGIQSTGGISEAGISKTGLDNLVEGAKYYNFMDPVSKEIDDTKLNNFTDPVTEIIKKLKNKGLNDSEITEVLETYGMGWCPETGATWIGTSPTPEELQKLPPRDYPFDDIPSKASSRSLTQTNQVMETKDYDYRGFNIVKCIIFYTNHQGTYESTS